MVSRPHKNINTRKINKIYKIIACLVSFSIKSAVVKIIFFVLFIIQFIQFGFYLKKYLLGGTVQWHTFWPRCNHISLYETFSKASDCVRYTMNPHRLPRRFKLQVQRLDWRTQNIHSFSWFYKYNQIISSMRFLNPSIHGNNIENMFQRSFPMPSKHRALTVKTHQLFYHPSYSLKTIKELFVLFKSFFAFYVPNIKALAQVIFHIKLRPILLKSVGSFFICYPMDPCYLLSVCDKDIKQTARIIVFWVGKKCVSASDKLHSALYMFTVTGTSHIKWMSGFTSCTLYSTVHGAFCSLL